MKERKRRSAETSGVGPVRAAAKLLAVVLAAGAIAAPGAVGQEISVTPQEGRVLREAAAFEAQGRLDEAEERVRDLLDQNPASAAGIYALERVLRARDHLEEILPALDAYFQAAAATRVVRRLELKVLSDLEREEELAEAVDRWIEDEPRDEDRYRVALPFVAETLGAEAALELIARAREVTERPDALALEAGDLNARLDRGDEAIEEWARAVGSGEVGVSTVLQRVRELPEEGERLVPRLVDALAAEPTTSARMRVAARLAVEWGWSERAVKIADATRPLLDDQGARKGFLAEFARRAEAGGEETRGAALWAYEALRGEAESPAEARALDRKLGELALLAGDTARALAARARGLEAMTGSSPQRRRATAELIELEARTGRTDEARGRLDQLRRAFPDAPELDAAAARVAAAYAVEGRSEEAAAVVEGVEGPESALQRAYLSLEREEVAEAGESLRTAAAGLEPERATGAVELLNLLQATRSEAGVGLLARIVGGPVDGAPEGLERTVEEGLPDVPLEERPGLVALAARLLDERGRRGGAARLRSLLVEEFPESVEAAEATVRLARYRAGREGRIDEAIALLEELIVTRPESAVVPEARRELQRLRGQIPGSNRSSGGAE